MANESGLSASVLETRTHPVSPLQGSPDQAISGLVGERLTIEAFAHLSGKVAGQRFVKVVVDRSGPKPVIHFLNHSRYAFHSDYIAEKILGIPSAELDAKIDEFNHSVYLSPDRKHLLGIVAHHPQSAHGEPFFTLETVEIDNMDREMVRFFYEQVKGHLDPHLPLLFKPANHLQETICASIPAAELPRILAHELTREARFVALHPGQAHGRLRAFRSYDEYKAAQASLEWFDIIVMHRVPDDIPRIAGIINAHHTAPLSHTNVLAHGWQIPNAIQIGIFDQIERDRLNFQWVNYTVDANAAAVALALAERPKDLSQPPAWSVQRIKLEEPETSNTPILELGQLRMGDRYKYGTKAANVGELHYLLANGSDRLIGFYKVKRPPRANLLSYLAPQLGLPEHADAPTISRSALEFLRTNIQVPRGIAIPFSVQQEFLESSPRIQQAIGKLKMALELDARETESICLSIQSMIRNTRMPERIRGYIDSQIANALAGVSCFVVRSSSNAEDLEGFSAAGIYESINHVTTAENIFQSIKEVWASLLSPRSVRLRQEVGISLDDCYMGVIVQEEVPADMGGVMVTTNPTNRNADFRNVYVNVSMKSVVKVVQGSELPNEYLYNTVEGGGRTLSIGDAHMDLDDRRKAALQKLAIAGRLLQSHFSPDYTFSSPVDVEWVWSEAEGLVLLQLRPYLK